MQSRCEDIAYSDSVVSHDSNLMEQAARTWHDSEDIQGNPVTAY